MPTAARGVAATGPAPESPGAPSAPDARRRLGRARATTAAELERVGLELFDRHGFDDVTVEQIAAAAGIGRRTFFRYFPSKNDLPWGDFDPLLAGMRAHLAGVGPNVPLVGALRDAIVAFNTYPDDVLPLHRRRMQVLLGSETLVAHSALRYAAWREVVSDFAAERLGVAPDAVLPNVIGRVCLAVTLAAYQEWLRGDAPLPQLIGDGFAGLRAVFGATEERAA